ncbi:MAG: Asp-tRNA(Asn)/Glu-tRNA(Gln) amidotransferase subunit GatB [Mycoplasma sp.]|nr:Asp-tRNA(Asn)/Glu-tRNA(Gln) amidotransferase subunit GatB [Mycoplasma sp.]
MLNNFIPTIGLEIHCVLNTKSKMFSNSKSAHNEAPNLNISYMDLALPGIMPTVNKAAVEKGIALANVLGMKIDNQLLFDRKNYFYHDLPKGFQITQLFHPIGRDGQIKLNNGNVIKIERIHLEEDTAKEFSKDGKIYLDYNRAGMPLIEIVTKPDIHSTKDAIEFLTKLKRNLTFMNISNAKMEDGSLRVDVNISISPVGSKKMGQRVEIKNINSFANVAKSIDYEINRQTELILKNQEILFCTMCWDEQTNKTVFMRMKDTEAQYNFIPEKNISDIYLTDKFINNVISKLNKTPDEIKNELMKLEIRDELIEQLLNDFDLYKVFDKVNSTIKDPALSISWIMVELVGYLKNKNKQISNLNSQQIELIIKLLTLLKSEEINGKQAKTIFPKMLDDLKEPSIIIKEKNFIQIKDEKVLEELLNKIIDKNPKMLEQYENRTERVLKYYLGMLMAETKGQANPKISNEILLKIIKKRLRK